MCNIIVAIFGTFLVMRQIDFSTLKAICWPTSVVIIGGNLFKARAKEIHRAEQMHECDEYALLSLLLTALCYGLILFF